MLQALKATLDITKPFDACVWAICACAFWGMMRFGEVTVASRAAFNGTKHLKRKDVLIGPLISLLFELHSSYIISSCLDFDMDGKQYARLDLPSAKTAQPGETQSVFVVPQEDICAIEALCNLATVVPAGPDDPLFSWRDDQGSVRPMVKTRAMDRINNILSAWGWGTSFGHSFQIGGASFYLSQKIDPEIVRLAGRWKSLAYEAYIRAFEQVVNRHMAGLLANTT
jgi:hypothetical protein